LLLLLALLLFAINAYSYFCWGTRPSQLERQDSPGYRIDLNQASRAELLQIPGIGPALAGRIETYRQEHDGFHNVKELDRVPGIGPATRLRVQSWVCVNGSPKDDGTDLTSLADQARSASLKRRGPVSSLSNASKKVRFLSGKIDINLASAEELRTLPGIGPKRSQAILEARSLEPFRSVEDLRRVPGIGPKTLEQLRPFVAVQTEPAKVVKVETPGAGQ
jgi:competence protein ComEA